VDATLYLRPGTRITTQIFEFAGYRYPVAELGQIRRVVLNSRLRHRLFELWAQFDGRTVRLFSCHNEREFGQVCRALVRAREYAYRR
jgi:hypothetical protein